MNKYFYIEKWAEFFFKISGISCIVTILLLVFNHYDLIVLYDGKLKILVDFITKSSILFLTYFLGSIVVKLLTISNIRLFLKKDRA